MACLHVAAIDTKDIQSVQYHQQDLSLNGISGFFESNISPNDPGTKVLGTPAAELLARKFRRNVGAAKMLRQPPFWLHDFEADWLDLQRN